MTSTKAVLLAFALTGTSLVIGGSTAAYIGYRKAQEKLGVSGSELGRTLSTFANFDETLADIAGTEGGEFGKRAAKLSDQHAFKPVESGALTERQVAAFIAVKSALLAIDQEMAADSTKEDSQKPSLGFLTKWNFFSRMQRLRVAEISELERQSMPVEEYNRVHYEIYKVFVSEGSLPANDKADWGTAISEALDRSTRAIDEELANSQTSAERRHELEQLRSSMTEGREVLTGTASKLQEELRSIPPENRRLVEQHKTELARCFMSAIDLDAIDIMKVMEKAGTQ